MCTCLWKPEKSWSSRSLSALTSVLGTEHSSHPRQWILLATEPSPLLVCNLLWGSLAQLAPVLSYWPYSWVPCFITLAGLTVDTGIDTFHFSSLHPVWSLISNVYHHFAGLSLTAFSTHEDCLSEVQNSYEVRDSTVPPLGLVGVYKYPLPAAGFLFEWDTWGQGFILVPRVYRNEVSQPLSPSPYWCHVLY